MLKSYIKIFVLLISLVSYSQETEVVSDSLDSAATDSELGFVGPKAKYGLRFGVDISRPIIAALDSTKVGIEFVADYRISRRVFIAAEFGYSDKILNEDFFTSETTGTFTKLGINYNLYNSWASMNNEVYVGVRYGFSFFKHNLIDYTPNYYGTYFDTPVREIGQEIDNLNAHWAELTFGLKVEMFNNFFMGTSIAFKRMLVQSDPDNFKNMYVPGFERVYENNTGFSFNYTLSYLIPIYKK